MPVYHVPPTEGPSVLGGREGARTFAPGTTGSGPWISPIDTAADLDALRRPRPAQSPKGFFLPACESLGQYGPETSGAATAVATETTVLLGVRACELSARAYLDQVMLEGEFADPHYRRRRDQTLIVACDCVDCAETCFCTAVGGQPFATEGYDVSLTPLEDGSLLVETATEAGQAWLASAPIEPAEADSDLLARRDEIRRKMTERVMAQNASRQIAVSDDAAPDLPNDADAAWEFWSADCVECGACTNICPTCHCFYLYDQLAGEGRFERVRTWDSCLLSSYHRMAGGEHMKLSPRPRLASRLANRVLHKFRYSPQQYDRLGCTGCGRCIDACLGAIDIRDVLENLGS